MSKDKGQAETPSADFVVVDNPGTTGTDPVHFAAGSEIIEPNPSSNLLARVARGMVGIVTGRRASTDRSR